MPQAGRAPVRGMERGSGLLTSAGSRSGCMDVHPAAAPATRPALPAAGNRSGAVEPPGPPDRSRSGPGRAVPDQAIPPARWTHREEAGAGPPHLSRREFVRAARPGCGGHRDPGLQRDPEPARTGIFPRRRSRLSRRGRIPRRSYGTLRSSSRQGGRPSARAGSFPTNGSSSGAIFRRPMHRSSTTGTDGGWRWRV